MVGKWGKWFAFTALLVAVCGCHTKRPNLKPTNQRAVLVAPPEGEARYTDPNQAVPKQAYMNREDPHMRNNQAIMPAGGMGGSSMGGMGGMGGR